MNSTQIQTTLAPLVALAAGLLSAKLGLFDTAGWSSIIFGVIGLGATVWGLWAARKTAQISSVAAMPEVQSIKLESSAPPSLVQATPSNVTK